MITRIGMNSLGIILMQLAFAQSHAGPLEYYFQKYLEETNNRFIPQSIEQQWFTQRIDHTNPNKGTFSQRYYVDETFSKNTNSPVFFYICGEAACTKNALNGAIRTYAKIHHAKLVALEHRYYGQSIPVPNYSAANLIYLSTEAGLEDLAAFQQVMMEEKHWSGKWVAFGGSYPGSLSAFYRAKFPDLVVGSLASSAPVRAKEDFIEYDTHVTKVAGPECANTMRAVVTEIEDALVTPQTIQHIKSLFEAEDIIDARDFLLLVADVGATAVQYGQKDAFCNALHTSTTPLEGYAQFARLLFHSMHVKAVDFTPQGAMSENPNDYSSFVGMRQWYYQSCKEYGYWQNANPLFELSTRSHLIDLNYHHTLCQRLFNLESAPDTEKMNENFYQPLLNDMVSRIFFTNGENDPWSTLSLSQINGNATNSNVTYYTIANAAHCEDMASPKETDSQSLKKAREIMKSLLGEWLKSD